MLSGMGKVCVLDKWNKQGLCVKASGIDKVYVLRQEE